MEHPYLPTQERTLAVLLATIKSEVLTWVAAGAKYLGVIMAQESIDSVLSHLGVVTKTSTLLPLN